MAEIDKYCDSSQGFQWMSDAQGVIGHVTELKIGGTDFPADMEVTNPEAVKGDPVKVVGVADSISWMGGIAHSVNITCWVSNTNKKTLMIMLHSEMDSTAVEFKFNVYDYDKEAAKYYMSFHTKDTVLTGNVKIEGGQRSLFLSDEPNAAVEKPENYQVVIDIVPEDVEQQLHLAASDTHKVALQWGLTRG